MTLTIDTAAVNKTRNEILEGCGRSPLFTPSTEYIISSLLKHSVDASPVHLATLDRKDLAVIAAQYSFQKSLC